MTKTILHSDDLGMLFNIALASSKIQEIQIPHMKLRSGIHLLLHGNIGSGKSDLLNSLCTILKITPSISLTRATLLGSVDKNSGSFIPPKVWDSRNSMLPIDEFSFDHKNPSDKSLLETLLQVMEKQEYEKSLGFKTVDFKRKNGDLFMKIKDNKLTVRTRFSLIMTTMHNPSRFQGILTKALVSRCIVIPHYPNLEDLKKKAKGINPFKFKNYKTELNVNINKRNYNKILDYLNEKKLYPEMYLRTVGDLCRAYAVIRKHDHYVYDLIYNLKYQINSEVRN